MNIQEIDRALERIVEQRNALSKLSYDDERYDELEDQLHDLEDQFLAKHGKVMKEVISEVHDEYCPDVDVLSPLSYIASEYKKTGQNAQGNLYDTDHNQGLVVDLDDYPGKNTRLVLIPNPLRMVLHIDARTRKEVWRAKNPA